MFLVDRARFFVQNLNGTPWLMLDTGRDLDGDGVPDIACIGSATHNLKWYRTTVERRP